MLKQIKYLSLLTLSITLTSFNVHATTSFVDRQINFYNQTTIENKLKLFDEMVITKTRNFNVNYYNDYLLKTTNLYQNNLSINKALVFKYYLENKANDEIKKEINLFYKNTTTEKMLANNKYQSLMRSYEKYKSKDEKANLIQLQYLVNDYRIKQGYEKKTIQKTIEGEKIKIAYLTFDDGPSDNTKKIVDILAKHDIRATFFFVGAEMKKKDRSEIVKYAITNSQIIGIHGYSHIFDKTKKRKTFEKELKDVQTDLATNYSYQTNLVRSPYGSRTLNKKDIEHYLKNDYYLWDWNVDSLDWVTKKNYKKVKRNIDKQMKELKDKKDIVVLYHEYNSTVSSLEDTIKKLKDKGFHIVNMNPEFFYSSYYGNEKY